MASPQPIGYYLSFPVPAELQALGEGGSLNLEKSLLCCEIAASAAASAFKAKEEGYSGKFSFAAALTNLFPTGSPDFSETDILWTLSLTCRGWLQVLDWFRDIAECRLRDSKG
ncbi:hypothetical protein NG791_16855 [Laspinema sp. D1]|uniref:hypothetical protein n=1 Tax=Laspinema palackyanum TaxID=3231601 RepID=UPI0034916896|nr:hypothetical protein [Laspinema sp. D2b]